MTTKNNKRLFRAYLILRDKIKAGVYSKEDIQDFDTISIKVATKSFRVYCIMMMAQRGMTFSWCHRLTQKTLQALIYPLSKNDQVYRRLILRQPDQTGKTTLAMLFITWNMGIDATLRVIYLTYSDARAVQITQDIISIMLEKDYKRIFPKMRLADELGQVDRQAEKTRHRLSKREFTNATNTNDQKQGKFISAGLTSTYLGASGDLIVADDLFNGMAEANSEVVREQKWASWTGNVISRQQAYSPMVLMGTYWNKDEIQGRMQDIYIDNEELLPEGTCKWKLIELNAIKDDRNYPYDPRKVGEVLLEIKKSYFIDLKLTNPVLFNIKCQNLPQIGTGTLFKASSFRYYDTPPTEISKGLIVFTIDTALKTKTSSDFTGFQIWSIANRNAYLLEWHDLKLSLPQLLQFVSMKRTETYPNMTFIVVEMKANGPGFVDMCGQYNISNSSILEFEPTDSQWNGDKVFRASLALHVFDTGHIYVPSVNLMPNINKFTDYFINFTGEPGRTDDQVDASVQMILKLMHLFRAYRTVLPRMITRESMQHNMLSMAKKFSPLKDYKSRYMR